LEYWNDRNAQKAEMTWNTRNRKDLTAETNLYCKLLAATIQKAGTTGVTGMCCTIISTISMAAESGNGYIFAKMAAKL
jgi:hypothetical protein